MHICQLHNSMANAKIYKCLPHSFTLDLTVSEINKIKTVDLQKVGQSNRVQFVQLHHSMANAKIIFKVRGLTFSCFPNISQTLRDKAKITFPIR